MLVTPFSVQLVIRFGNLEPVSPYRSVTVSVWTTEGVITNVVLIDGWSLYTSRIVSLYKFAV